MTHIEFYEEQLIIAKQERTITGDNHILAITFEILHVYVVKGRERFMIGLLSHKIEQIKRIHMRDMELYNSNLSFSLMIFMTKKTQLFNL